MIAPLFHSWERRLSTVDTNRVIRPFEWGLDWLGLDTAESDAGGRLADWAARTVAESDRFYATEPWADFERHGDRVRFASAIQTPEAVNNTVVLRVFPGRERPGARRRAVLVLPQWNADAGGHVGLCQLIARFGITAVRLSLPYHDVRKPADLQRSDYIVCPNLGRTLQTNRQAVLDARRAVDWMEREGFERIGILGTSLGSCLAMLAMTHDARIATGVFNHVSPYFADVVWRGISTRHVRAGLEGHVALDDLRRYWMPISPWPFIERTRGRRLRLIYARYDLTFPVDLSERLIGEFRRRGLSHDTALLPCGHYTTGRAPFKFMDGYYMTSFLVKNL